MIFTKNSFSTCMQAFYAEIKDSRNAGKKPVVVLYRYTLPEVKFNPRESVRVMKDSVFVNGENVKFCEIRGLDFYFEGDRNLVHDKGTSCEHIDLEQYMADRINANKKPTIAPVAPAIDPAMEEYNKLMKSLGA